MPFPTVPFPYNACSCGHDFTRHAPNCVDCPTAHPFAQHLANNPVAATISRGG